MQKMLSKMTAAIEKYQMIDENDKIAVGISGGKDSIILLMLLNELKKFYHKKFEIMGLTLDPGFPGENSEEENFIAEYCKKENIEYIIKQTNIYNIVFETRKEKNPCSLCAKMRRGILHNTAKEYECNKIALGHHFDDAVETFMMNLVFGGRIKCFSPKSYLSIKEIYQIRPLIFMKEEEIIKSIKKNNIKPIKSKCPIDKTTKRNEIKELIEKIEKQYNGLSQKIMNAMQKDDVSNWKI